MPRARREAEENDDREAGERPDRPAVQFTTSHTADLNVDQSHYNFSADQRNPAVPPGTTENGGRGEHDDTLAAADSRGRTHRSSRGSRGEGPDGRRDQRRAGRQGRGGA